MFFHRCKKKKIERCDAFWISKNVCTTFFPFNRSKNTKCSAVVNNHCCIRLNKAAYCIRVIKHMSEFNLDLQQDKWMLNCVFTESEWDSRESEPSNSMSTLNWMNVLRLGNIYAMFLFLKMRYFIFDNTAPQCGKKLFENVNSTVNSK